MVANLRCLLEDGRTIPFPANAEIPVLKLREVGWEVAGQQSFGSATLTNFRLIFEPSQSQRQWMTNLKFPMELSWGALGRFYLRQDRLVDSGRCAAPGQLLDVVVLRCTDFRVIRLINLDSQISTSTLRINLESLWRGANDSNMSPFVEKYGPTGLWKILDWKEEFKRQGVPPKWKFYDAEDIPSYPSTVKVPETVTDKEIQATQNARVRRRFPVLTWWHRTRGSALLRCGQPHGSDAMYVEKCRQSVHEQARMVFFDCRSKSAVWGNHLSLRGGTEKSSSYPSMGPIRDGDKSNATVITWDIPNIHVMRRSYVLLHKLVTRASQEKTWLQRVNDTEWLYHCRKLTEVALNVAQLLDGFSPSQPPVCVAVHCSDGWDRTSQVCSLAQLLLDPYFRTRKGLCVLIEKDWVEFGHNFRSRSRALSDGGSPIFQQWLFCVASICRQFPEHFEYNSSDLTQLLDLFLSHWTRTLGCDNERERRGLEHTQVSLWSLWLASGSRDEHPMQNVPHLIYPLLSMKYSSLWDFVLRFDEISFRVYKPLRVTDTSIRWPPTAVWWLKDSAAIACMHCRRPFGVLRSRHHCRACGLLFCKKCIFYADLDSLGYELQQQVCVMCFELYQISRCQSSLEDYKVKSSEETRLWEQASPDRSSMLRD